MRPVVRVLAMYLIAQVFILCAPHAVRPVGAAPPTGYSLAWSDEFNGSALDTTRWNYLELGLRRLGKDAVGYTNIRDAVTVGGGFLRVLTYTVNGKHYSGMISTGPRTWPDTAGVTSTYMPRYGYVEARIKFTGASGMWSSFYLQSLTAGYPRCDGSWDPHRAGVEMDIVEHRVHDANDQIVTNAIPSTNHWDGYGTAHQYSTSGMRGTKLGTGFHTYGLKWTPDSLIYSIDGGYLWSVHNDPAQNPQTPNPDTTPVAPVPQRSEFIILCSEVFNRALDPYAWDGTIPTNGFGALADTATKMTVDYVRWYQTSVIRPNRISDLSVTSIGKSSMALSWTAPGDSISGEQVLQYKLCRSKSPITESNFATLKDSVTFAASHGARYAECRVVTGLSGCTSYYWAMKSKDKTGRWSALSNVPYAKTQCSGTVVASCGSQTPDAIPPAAITTLAVSSLGSRALALSWTAPGDDGMVGTTSEYDVRYATSPITDFATANRYAVVAPHAAGYSESCVVPDLTCGTHYYFAMKAKDDAGNWSAVSNAADAVTASDCILPYEVWNLSTTSRGSSTVALSWTAPGNDGATGTAARYDMRYSTSPITLQNFGCGAPIALDAPLAPGSQECRVVTGLSPNTRYYFALKTADASGNWSGMGNVATDSTLSNAPADITDLAVGIARGNTTLAVQWTSPGNVGGGYDLRFATWPITPVNFCKADAIPAGPPDAAGTAECVMVTGLSACTRYYFAIRATDPSGGWSGISNVATDTTVCGHNYFAECTFAGAPRVASVEPARLSFSRLSPNPARVATSLQLSIPSQGTKLRVGVFDVAGRRVRSLIDGTMPVGLARIEWNLADDAGHHVAPALYLMRVDIAGTRKVYPIVVLH